MLVIEFYSAVKEDNLLKLVRFEITLLSNDQFVLVIELLNLVPLTANLRIRSL